MIQFAAMIGRADRRTRDPRHDAALLPLAVGAAMCLTSTATEARQGAKASDRLGIADQIRPKLTLPDTDVVAQLVSQSDVVLGSRRDQNTC